MTTRLEELNHQPSQSRQREIAIFWDYENVPLPSYCNAAIAAKAIVNAVSPHGRIVDRRLYLDLGKRNKYPTLDQSGFDLVNTPLRSQKETLDKKMIADVFTFAWDSAVRTNDNSNAHTKPCVVLLTSDGEYAYTISKLRDRGIMTVVMVKKDCAAASILMDCADISLSLEDDVLRPQQLLHVEATAAAAAAAASLNRLQSKSPVNVLKSNSTGSTNNSTSNSTSTGSISISTSTGSTVSDKGDDAHLMASLCSFIDASANEGDLWMDFGSVSLHLQHMIRNSISNGEKRPVDVRLKAKDLRAQAENRGLIEVGRRKLDLTTKNGERNGCEREIVAALNSRVDLNLSNEVYVRLMPKGKVLATEFNNLSGTVSEATRMTLTAGANKMALLATGANKMTSTPTKMTSTPTTPTGQRYDAPTATGTATTVTTATTVAATTATTTAASSTSQALDNDLTKSLCSLIRQRDPLSPDGWVDLGSVSKALQDVIRRRMKGTLEDVKEKAKAIRSQAENRNLIEIGRRKLDLDPTATNGESEREIVASSNREPHLSVETYVRLLPIGKSLLDNNNNTGGSKTTAKGQSKSGHDASSMASSSMPTNVFLRGIPRQTKVKELVEWIETSYHVTVRRALLRFPVPNGPTCQAHLEFFQPEDATTVFQEANNKLNGGKGIYFRNRAIGIVMDSRPKSLDNKGDGFAYYESDNMALITSASATDSGANKLGDDTSNDVAELCFSVYLEEVKAGQDTAGISFWINSGSACARFRSKLPQKYLKAASNYEVNQRVRNARRDAILGGFIEMGRRKTEVDSGTIPECVTVPLDARKVDDKLSAELYLRLLPLGRSLAAETRALVEASATTQSHGETSAVANRSLFMRNLPQTANAKQFAEFLEATLSCSVLRLHLEEGKEGVSARSAQVEFSSAEERNQVLLSIEPGLVYCGQYIIYTVPDRIISEDFMNTVSHPDMAYIKDQVDEAPSSSPIDFALGPDSVILGLNINQFMNDIGIMTSSDSVAVVNDHQSINAIGSPTTPNIFDIWKDPKVDDLLWS